MRWHVHLPTDLPWDGQRSAVLAVLRLMERLSFLRPSRAVLHLPKGSRQRTEKRLRHFVAHWSAAGYSPAMLLLENTAHQSLRDLESLIFELGCGVCLDLGHLLHYGQLDLLDRPGLLSRVGLTHWSAPGGEDRHQPLTALSLAERHTAKRLAELTENALPLIEVFDWTGIEASWPVLREWYAGRAGRLWPAWLENGTDPGVPGKQE